MPLLPPSKVDDNVVRWCWAPAGQVKKEDEEGGAVKEEGEEETDEGQRNGSGYSKAQQGLKRVSGGATKGRGKMDMKSLFNAEEEEEEEKEKKRMGPLVPIEYDEDGEAKGRQVQQEEDDDDDEEWEEDGEGGGLKRRKVGGGRGKRSTASAPAAAGNAAGPAAAAAIAAAAEFAKRLSQGQAAQGVGSTASDGTAAPQAATGTGAPEKPITDAKSLIDSIPKTKAELFAFPINWAVFEKVCTVP